MATRRMRAFKRWMRLEGVECSDALNLIDHHHQEGGGEGLGISVTALCDLHEGDLVATIPKRSCLTIKTSGARQMIEAAGFEGYLGLSVALMYEKSLGQESPWFGYLQLLPESECIPLLWSLIEVDSLLFGTELHKIVTEDKGLIYEDWKECILPLLDSAPVELNPDFFGVEQYFAAKSLIASRSFEIDDYYGFGMVPLADLFNHKTGAEDVHFTSVSDNEIDDSNTNNVIDNNDSPTVLEMIIVKDVKAGDEVFNTYGSLGNAALLHRYGFTEPDNPFDIVNVDLELVLQWSSSLFSARHSRTRLSLWRRLGYSGCGSQSSEYFEISLDGEPQLELLILLHLILLPVEAYHELDLRVSTARNSEKSTSIILSERERIALGDGSETSQDMLLTTGVQSALMSLADIRESLYGSSSVEEDIEAMKSYHHCIRERKVYNSLMLRVSERRILEKLRTYSSVGTGLFRTSERATMRKKLKRT